MFDYRALLEIQLSVDFLRVVQLKPILLTSLQNLDIESTVTSMSDSSISKRYQPEDA